VSGTDSANVGFKFKPDTFDGSVPLREFLTQFDLIAQINAETRFGEDSRIGVEFEGKSTCGSRCNFRDKESKI